MRKETTFLLVCVSLILIISMPVVSAGFFSDVWENVKEMFGGEAKITGNTIGVCEESGPFDPFVKGWCNGEDNLYIFDYCDMRDLGSGLEEVLIESNCVQGGEYCAESGISPVDVPYESCDDGVMITYCGNSVIDTGLFDGEVSFSESCDDGNTEDGDGCYGIFQQDYTSWCAEEAFWDCVGEPSYCYRVNCGNGVKDLQQPLSAFELCDDGNFYSGDGCSNECAPEWGYNCTGFPSVCNPICGDYGIRGNETCDDSNTNDRDGCSSVCQLETGKCTLVGGAVSEECSAFNNNYLECDSIGCAWSYLSCTDSDGDDYFEEGFGCGHLDCNALNSSINPGSLEICGNNVDEDCDGVANDCACSDGDQDGYGVLGSSECTYPGVIDCNDTNSNINVGIIEICGNEIDDNCNKQIDEPVEEFCGDDADNDCDGLIDEDCEEEPEGSEDPESTNDSTEGTTSFVENGSLNDSLIPPSSENGTSQGQTTSEKINPLWYFFGVLVLFFIFTIFLILKKKVPIKKQDSFNMPNNQNNNQSPGPKEYPTDETNIQDTFPGQDNFNVADFEQNSSNQK
ncbi:DUF4215 domain-containing protein [Candidatus Pacearchaeota archaeon]|nr:DUF4215 domain-containing protein [Candidatus Pacearchaeota archaeon]